MYTHNGILVIKKAELLPFAATWIDLRLSYLREVKQAEKDIYHLYVESKKNEMNLLTKWEQTQGT